MQVSDLFSDDEETIDQAANLLLEGFRGHSPAWPDIDAALTEVRESFWPRLHQPGGRGRAGHGLGFDVTITILDGKTFLRQGAPGCSMCAGVISETLRARLEEKGIRLPKGRVQRRRVAFLL